MSVYYFEYKDIQKKFDTHCARAEVMKNNLKVM